MSALEPLQVWWTSDEIAAATLPYMPGTKQGVNVMAERLDWRSYPHVARRRSGRGGGWEYHWTLFSREAQTRLLKEAAAAHEAEPEAPIGAGEAWEAFDTLPDTVKQRARERLAAVQMAEALYQGGATHVVAMSQAARQAGFSVRSLYNWWDMIRGVEMADRLPYLAPRNRLAVRKDTRVACSKAFMDHLKSLYLRLEQPTFRQCYRTACRLAKDQGWTILAERTAQRRLEEDVPRVARIYAREGVSGLMRCYPAQIRDRSALKALEAVNADCHKIDVFVRWPDGSVNRPQIVGFQDIYSGKILSWRVDHDPNKVMVMAAFGELVENWGLPKRCLFDNGHEFANKWMTAGTATRFRFKVRDDDPLGVLPLLGIEVHWATPAHGQAKPIERAFRDLASDVAKDIRFAGAYVGNRPDAKPENYGSRAVPVETFLAVLAEGIAEHNARQGRLSATALGRSFDDTFAESYQNTPIRKATDEQRRLWMMGQHVTQLRRGNGQVRLYGNYYHADWMSQRAGEQVVARFDPEDLHSGLHIYDAEGGYLGFAECQQKVGFFDLIGAREQARRNARIKRAARELAKAHASIPATELAARLTALAPEPPQDIAAKVVAPEFGRSTARLPMASGRYQPPDNPEIDAVREAMILEMGSRSASPPKEPAETPADRYWRAQAILKRSEAGETIGSAEAAWVAGYIETGEFQGLLHMEQAFGADGVG